MLPLALAGLPSVPAIAEFLAKLLAYLMIIFLPVMWLSYTDRFRRLPQPGQLARVFGMITAVGVLLSIPAASIVGVCALLAVALAWFFARFSLSSVRYERILSSNHLMCDDEIDLTVRVENRKILPLGWLDTVDPLEFTTSRASAPIHQLLQFSGGLERQEHGQYALVNHVGIAPFQTVSRTYHLQGLHRGVYLIGPAKLASGDPFGMFDRSAEAGSRDEIVVYPRTYQMDELGLANRQWMGEQVVRRALIEDPTLLAGSREYRPGDAFHRLHWKATARTGALQVRQHDSSTTAELMILLNLNTFQRFWQGVDAERMEAAISVTASLALEFLDKGFAVGVRSNGRIGDGEVGPRVAAGASKRQGTIILDHLARLNFAGGISPTAVLIDEARRLSAGGTLLFVTATMTPEIIASLASKVVKNRVSVVYCGRFAAPVIPGLEVHLAAPTRTALHAVS